MARNWGASVEKGKLSKDEMDARLARVRGTLSYDDLADVDLVIEAVFEDMAVKKQVFATLDAVCRPGAISRRTPRGSTSTRSRARRSGRRT